MEVNEMNKCLSTFYVSVRRKDDNFYKKSSLLSLRAALDRHLKSPPYNKKFSICDNYLFSEANKTLNSYLKQLVSEGKIAGTVHKNPLTSETIKKLYEEGELTDADTRDPRVLLQTVWFFVSIYFGKRGRENQHLLKKSMLRLMKTADGEEFFELNKSEPGAVLTSKNHTGGLDGTEDHSDGKIFALATSRRCPVEVLKLYLSHLNPNSEALFQRPKDLSSAKFNPTTDDIWYERRQLGHNTLENMLRKMTEKAGIVPYLTNHSLRATTVTVLSANNIETRKIKAITGHKSDTSVESYCQRPTLDQFKQMSSALTSFISGKESPETSLSVPSTSTTTVPAMRSSSDQRLPLERHEENFLLSAGLNPGAILPSGNFHNCSFTFNVNVNKGV